ncbi:regulatory LuxR family protein [Cytobacillus oceanisediminis]|uniref:Regulatory LuxR family protein n=1 Tax=Cytobacillus oceanisediminis TaxID=665099 RepID=A0A2V2ZTQ6_9BACI|nr:LuxR C-terminal-related transcriptional regulator [Cytobacillus oceanisediminis]PWW27047.1 regulatory LuxR family protein [Cytobacillus oceanisediminis]
MIQSLELMEELQELYAGQSGLTNLVTNMSGDIIAPAKGNNELFNLLLEQGGMKGIIKTITKEYDLSKTFLYDMLPGVYVCIAPVNGHSGLLLWSGVKIEQGLIDKVKNNINSLINERDIDSILAQTPALTLENKREWIHSAKKAALMISRLMEEGDSSFSGQLEVLQEAANMEEGDVSRLLCRFLEKNSRYDFLGVCEQRFDDLYEVSHAAGEEAERILGASFSPGESFLGRMLLTGEYAFWEGVERDPKYTFFERLHFYPKSLFCFPVELRDGSLSLIFGGSRKFDKFSDTDKVSAKNVALLIEAALLTDLLKKENSGHLRRLSAIADVSGMLVSAPDLKRISYILVDIAMNLVKGPFSTVILKNPLKQKMMLISRGDIKGEIGGYLKMAAGNYFTKAAESISKSLMPSIKQIEGASAVIECPLHFRGELLGLICAGTRGHPEQEMEELLPFLHTLSLIAGFSLQLAGDGQENILDTKVDTLHSSIKEFDAEAYRIAKEAFKAADEFSIKLDLSETLIKNVLSACLLYCFTPEYLAEMFPETEFPRIVKDGKRLLSEEISFDDEPSIGSQVFAAAVSYAQNEGNLDTVISNPKIDSIRQEFISFMEEKQVMVQELTLEPESSHTTRSQSVGGTIKNHLNLSNREKEVLELVIQGLNNKEIAQELFISEHTVKNHLTKIFQKLNVPDRTQAISKVYQLTYNKSAKP